MSKKITLTLGYDVRRWDTGTIDVSDEEYERFMEADEDNPPYDLVDLFTSRAWVTVDYDEMPDPHHNAAFIDVRGRES